MADDTQGVALAMEHLQKIGHREIAVVSAHLDHRVDRVQIAAWRAALPRDWDESHIKARTIVVDTPRHESRADHVYQTVRDYLRGDDGQTTALLCLLEEMSLPALAACREAGRAAPEKMSLIASGNNPMLAYAHPPVTCIDVNIEEHLNQAMILLEKFAGGISGDADILRLVEPHLELRQSVQTPAK